MNDFSFGNFLYTLRSEKGLSQAQLGEMLGVTNKAVSKWENGSTKPNTVLIPRIAEIFGITVEELFACKRFEKDSEFENIKRHLSGQKKKYAILSSVFLSIVISLPLLLIEFICVVNGFHISDDIAGPLGAMGFILSFVISLTSFIIYRRNFKQALIPSEISYPHKFSEFIKRGLLFSAISWWCIFILMFSIYLLILSLSSNFTPANIFLSIAIFILIILSGTFVYFANVKRLLKIKFTDLQKNKPGRIQFSSLPAWGKICYIATIVLFPFVLNIQILGALNSDWLLIKLVSMLVWFAVVSPLIIYNVKRK